MKTIIVPTDFSPTSINAANFAANMAIAIDAEILLLNVFNIPLAYSGDVPLMLLSVEDLKKASLEQLELLKEKMTKSSSGKVTIKVQSQMGNTVDELEILCNQIKPFAVVMGAKGTSGIEKVLFGSTALTAIRHLTYPVMCIPDGIEYGKGIKKIGFACDFEHVAETTPVHYIKEIVKEFNAELHILNVDYKDRHFSPAARQESFLLHEMFKDLNPEYHYINDDDVEFGIYVFAIENNLDLIIAIPKKHKLLEGIFKPARTRQLISKSQVPVMCVHE